MSDAETFVVFGVDFTAADLFSSIQGKYVTKHGDKGFCGAVDFAMSKLLLLL